MSWVVRSQLFRSLAGPLIVGAGVWCAAGTVTVAGVDAAGVRLAVPASIWWLVAGSCAAAVVPAWRRSPVLATPALLAVAPWLPIPLPASALIWTGTLAWFPVALAVVAALCAGLRPPRVSPGPVEPTASPRRQAAAAAALTVCAALLTWWALDPRLPGGDEPHYLIITQSILQDGDLRIENNHDARDYEAYWAGTLAPDYIQRGRDGAIYSIHAPGVSVLVAPLFALFGLRGAQLTLVACAAATGALVWMMGWLAAGDRRAAWFAWAAVVGSLTFLVQSVMIFPDGPGATVVAAAAVMWLRLARGDRVAVKTLVLVSGLLAALPFLHTRFVVLSVVSGLAIVWALWTGEQWSAAERRRAIAFFVGLPAVGAISWFGSFFLIYGTPNPVIAYGSGAETTAAYIPGGVAGLLFDQQFGLFVYAPVLTLALFGWWRPRRSAAGPSLTVLGLVVVTYAAAVSMYWMWWAGVPATPARLLTSVLPLLAAPVAVAWTRMGVPFRSAAATLLAASLAVSAYVLANENGAMAWNVRGGYANWLVGLDAVADLPQAWPSFFRRLVPGDVTTEWPFAVHIALWIAVFGGLAVALSALVRTKPAADDVQVARGVWWLPVGLMLAAQAGWWFGDSTGIGPAGSQVAMWRRAATGEASVWAVGLMSLSRVPAADVSLRVTLPRVDSAGAPAEWGALKNVPAGRYGLHLSARRPTGGTLTVHTGNRAAPIAVIRFERLSEQTVPLELEREMPILRFTPDETLAAGARRLDVVAGGGAARSRDQ